MADMNKHIVTYDFVSSITDSFQGEKQATREDSRVLHKAFSHLTDVENAVVHWELTDSCPCKMETSLELKEGEGGMTWKVNVCDLCDYDARIESSQVFSDAIGQSISAWTTTVGKKHLINAIARETNLDPDEIGVSTDPHMVAHAQDLNKQLAFRTRMIEILVEMLDTSIKMIDRKRTSKANNQVLDDMHKTMGAIIQSVLKDDNKQATTKDVANKLIDEIDGQKGEK
tara:strand:+ start:2102 stop:2785 length:684 start_codon:yes stop_codon:yes gene_type:complete